ncbi:AGE family epimerase/isomerase [Marinigracilibium pacificum]|uniref:Cellobiose 2-epimerase n=1 Tax=Marinigracilibium pacificum TaxID=2729599 RepID=A0A848J1S2_9BACT|nr:AGE family epimerase/isomerase [Marinigracilibium pacificum]NMM49288.1 N-acyl-D-glucosamine 2-epimerase [Marinigracilibium pacificum]
MDHHINLKSNGFIRKELIVELINIMDYWSQNMVDELNGGFYGRIDGRNILQKDAEKGVVLNSRILWTFSAAFNLFKDPKYKKIAERAYLYIIEHFLDKQFGGVYWMLDVKGTPLVTKKQIYAQAFAIYGLSEYYKINEDPSVLSKAVNLFDLIEKHAFDPIENGYFEAFSCEWSPLKDVRLSEKDLNAQKTMNTHLHILEAYTNLYSVWKDENLKGRLRNLIDVLIEYFVSPSNHFNLFFDETWRSLSNDFSYGHDIEGSWLLVEAAEAIEDKNVIKKIKPIAVEMVDASLEGMDNDGGLMNEGNSKGIIDTDKHWWPQAEALVGLINAWQMTNNKFYLDQVFKTWIFIKDSLIDREHGEWFWKVSKEGVISFEEDKAGPWKCPYHNGRAMMECLKRLGY